MAMHAGICHVLVIGCILISVQLPSSGPGHNSRDDKPVCSPGAEGTSTSRFPEGNWRASVVRGMGMRRAAKPHLEIQQYCSPPEGTKQKTGGEYYATTLGPLFRFRYDPNPWHLVVEEKKRRKEEGSKPTEPR